MNGPKNTVVGVGAVAGLDGPLLASRGGGPGVTSSTSFSSHRHRHNRRHHHHNRHHPYAKPAGPTKKTTTKMTSQSSNSSSSNRRQSRRSSNTTVYVGNLAYEVSWQDLKDYMRSVGEEVVHVEILTMHDGRSKGCGIVQFATPEGANAAIHQLHDTELKGRLIFVREDREEERSGGGGGGGGNNGNDNGGGWRGNNHNGNNNNANLSVYVGNLAYETTWQDLKDHMRLAGNVDKADILQSDDGRSKGCGIVLYQKAHEAARAIRELQNSILHGRPIFIREDREQRTNNNGSGGGGYHLPHRSPGKLLVVPTNEECRQLYVGNLSWETGWRELKDYFRNCGEVERSEVAEGNDGRKKGYGLIRYVTAKDAARAIEELNGMEFMGRPLEVRFDNRA